MFYHALLLVQAQNFSRSAKQRRPNECSLARPNRTSHRNGRRPLVSGRVR